MSPTAKKEKIAVASLFIAFIIFLIPSLIYARRELWDSTQIRQMIKVKEKLEQYNNKHQTYPLEFKNPPFEYVVTEKDSKGALAWYLRTPTKNTLTSKNGFDEEEGRNYYFRIVNENNKTFYDICGGSFTCDVIKK
jgi:hypothetical protein